MTDNFKCLFQDLSVNIVHFFSSQCTAFFTQSHPIKKACSVLPLYFSDSSDKLHRAHNEHLTCLAECTKTPGHQ